MGVVFLWGGLLGDFSLFLQRERRHGQLRDNSEPALVQKSPPGSAFLGAPMQFQRLGHLKCSSHSFHTINLLNSSPKSLFKGKREKNLKGLGHLCRCWQLLRLTVIINVILVCSGWCHRSGRTSLPHIVIPIYWLGKLRHRSASDQASQLASQGRGYRFKVSNIHKRLFYPLVSFNGSQQWAELVLFERGCEPSAFKAQETPSQWGLKERFPMGRLCWISPFWSSTIA